MDSHGYEDESESMDELSVGSVDTSKEGDDDYDDDDYDDFLNQVQKRKPKSGSRWSTSFFSFPQLLCPWQRTIFCLRQ